MRAKPTCPLCGIASDALGAIESRPAARIQARREILGGVRPSPFYSLVAALSWPVLRGLFRLRAEGRENLPTEGGYVLSANHVSNLDPWPLGLPLWPKRYLRFMAKSELYWFPLNHVIKAGGGFPVRRGEREIEGNEKARQPAPRRHVVGVFPPRNPPQKGPVKREHPKRHTR